MIMQLYSILSYLLVTGLVASTDTTTTSSSSSSPSSSVSTVSSPMAYADAPIQIPARGTTRAPPITPVTPSTNNNDGSSPVQIPARGTTRAPPVTPSSTTTDDGSSLTQIPAKGSTRAPPTTPSPSTTASNYDDGSVPIQIPARGSTRAPPATPSSSSTTANNHNDDGSFQPPVDDMNPIDPDNGATSDSTQSTVARTPSNPTLTPLPSSSSSAGPDDDSDGSNDNDNSTEDPLNLYGPLYGPGFPILPALPPRGWWNYGYRYTITLCPPASGSTLEVGSKVCTCILKALEYEVSVYNPTIVPGWLVPITPSGGEEVVPPVATDMVYGSVTTTQAPCNWLSFLIPFNWPLPNLLTAQAFAQPLLNIIQSSDFKDLLEMNCSIPNSTHITSFHKGAKFQDNSWVTTPNATENGALANRLTLPLILIPPVLSFAMLLRI